MRLRSASDPQISPDGRVVVYVVRAADLPHNTYQSSVWLVRVPNGTPEKLAATAASPHHPRWSPDGTRLAFLASSGGVNQLFIADARGKDITQLSHSRTAVTGFRWSHDNRQIGYVAADPPTAEEQDRVRRGDDAIVANRNYKYSRIYTVPASGGEARIITKASRQVLSFDWSPDDRRVVYAGQDTPRTRDLFHTDIFVADVASGDERVLVQQPGRDADPSWSPDGKWIAFHSQGGTLNYFTDRRVALVPAAGGKLQYLDFEGDVFRTTNGFTWSQDSGRLIFGAGRGTNDYLYSLNVGDGTAKPLLDSLAATSGFSLSRDNTRAAFLKASPDHPPEVWLADFTATSPHQTRLADVNPEIADLPQISSSTLRWKSKDGLPVEGVLRLPVGYKQGDRVPLLVELHGGPVGVALEAFPIPRTYPTQLFLQQGFAVLAPNFRGSSNYGGKFRLANIKSQGFGDFDDVMTGIDTLVEQGIADPARLGVMGWSYGGYLTTWIIGATDRFKAASIGASAADWIAWYGATDGPPETMWTYFGGKPWDTWQEYNRHSPRYHLIHARTPTTMQHGQRDIDSTAEIFQALTDLKVPSEFITYPREGHGFVEPVHQRDLMERNLRWFEQWILKK